MSDRVWTYSGGEYAERPRALKWEGDRLEIVEILDRWRAPGRKGFRVRTSDERVFELIYDELLETWNIQLISEQDAKEST